MPLSVQKWILPERFARQDLSPLKLKHVAVFNYISFSIHKNKFEYTAFEIIKQAFFNSAFKKYLGLLLNNYFKGKKLPLQFSFYKYI
jgi:hypothetical protein